MNPCWIGNKKALLIEGIDMEQAKLVKVEDGTAYYQQIVAIPISAFGKLADDPKWKPPARLSIVDYQQERIKELEALCM